MRWLGLAAGAIVLFGAFDSAAKEQDSGAEVDLWVEASGALYVEIDLPAAPAWHANAQARLSEALGAPFALERTERDEEGWYVQGQCEGLFTRRTFSVEGTVPLANLVRLAVPSEGDAVHVMLSHPRLPSFANTLPNAERSHDKEDAFFDTELSPEETPAMLSVQFGYGTLDILRGVLPIPLAFVLLILFALWHSKRALASTKPAEEVWFAYWHTNRLAGCASIVLFVAALHLSHGMGLIEFATGHSSHMASLAISMAGYVVLIVVAVICLAIIARPVEVRIRRIEITREHMFYQILSLTLGACLPLCLLLVAIGAVADSEMAWAAACAVGGVLSLFASARLSWKGTGIRIEALNIGALQDRVSELAAKVGARVTQIYIMTPAAKAGIANAAAMQGNMLLLSDYLIEHLSTREVEAIVAHELGHIRDRHVPNRQGAIGLCILVGLIAIAAIVFSAKAMAIDVGVLVASVGGPILAGLTFGMFAYMRRQERRADMCALALCGDPEALITGLAKINRLNMMPLAWSGWRELTMTHPSTLKRCQAIARISGVSSERLAALLQDPNTGEARYSLPEAVLNPQKAFSTAFRVRHGRRILWSNVALFAVIPAAVAWLVLHLGIEGHARWAAYLGGMGLTVLTAIVANSFLAVGGWRNLRRRIGANLAQEGLDPAAWNGTFVSLTPGSELRVYEGYTNWDIGFMALAGGALCFVGENTRFAVPRDQIRAIHPATLAPDWSRPKRVCITWHDPERNEKASFWLAPGEIRSMLHMTSASRRMQQRLRAWLADPSADSGDPSGISRLPLPQLSGVTGTPWKACVNANLLFMLMMRQMLWTFFACLFLGLIWEPAEYGPGCCALVASLLARLIFHLPSFFYKAPATPTAPEAR